MSKLIGNRLPAPLRFEFGAQPPAETAHALLLATIDRDGLPRIAVLSRAEVSATDDRCLTINVRADGATCENLQTNGMMALWCVLDAAAYTVKGSAKVSGDPAQDGWRRFLFEVNSVWRDFEPSAPMIAGPTYRTPNES